MVTVIRYFHVRTYIHTYNSGPRAGTNIPAHWQCKPRCPSVGLPEPEADQIHSIAQRTWLRGLFVFVAGHMTDSELFGLCTVQATLEFGQERRANRDHPKKRLSSSSSYIRIKLHPPTNFYRLRSSLTRYPPSPQPTTRNPTTKPSSETRTIHLVPVPSASLPQRSSRCCNKFSLLPLSAES